MRVHTKGLIAFFKRSRGFTLLELMVVVAILGILTSHTSQVITRTRITSNEGATLGNLVAVRSAFEMFRTFSQRYPNSLPELTGYADRAITAGQKHGYTLTLSNQTQNTYTVTASPTSPGITGIRTFVLDQSGFIREFDGRIQGMSSSGNFSLSWSLTGVRLANPISSFFWRFTSLADRTLQDALIAVQNVYFGGPGSVGSRLLSDGQIRLAGSRVVDFYRLGNLDSGESRVIEERIWTPLSVGSVTPSSRAAASNAPRSSVSSSSQARPATRSTPGTNSSSSSRSSVASSSANRSSSSVARPATRSTTQTNPSTSSRSNLSGTPSSPAGSVSLGPQPNTRWWYSRSFGLYERNQDGTLEEQSQLTSALSGRD